MQAFDVVISGTGYSQQAWTTSIEGSDIAGLPTGQYTLAVIIDAYGTGSFTQESTDNDVLLTTFSLPELPDVFVDPLALANRSSVAAGEFVDWSMTATNTGDVTVSGTFSYTWEGQTFESHSSFLRRHRPTPTPLHTEPHWDNTQQKLTFSGEQHQAPTTEFQATVLQPVQ